MLGIRAELLKQARPVVMRMCLAPRVSLGDLLKGFTSQLHLDVFLRTRLGLNNLHAPQNVWACPTLNRVRNPHALGDGID